MKKNRFTCQMCGVTDGEPHPYDGKKTRIYLERIIDSSMGGTDDPSNLRAICSICREGASTLILSHLDAVKLLARIQRAPNADQLNVLKWIVQKFPLQAKKLLED